MNLIHCLTSRCGSTSLCRALNYSTVVKCCHEPFNPDCHDSRFAMNYTIHKHGFGDTRGVNTSFDDAYSSIVLDRQNWNTIKNIDPHLNNEDSKKLIDACEATIYLYRENVFDSMVSSHLSWTLTEQEDNYKFWNFPPAAMIGSVSDMSEYAQEAWEAYKTRQRKSLEINHIAKKFKYLKDRHRHIKNYLKDKKSIVISYEKLYNDSHSEFPKLASFLEYDIINDDWKKFFDPKKKVASEESKKLIENYDELIKYREEFKLDD